MQQQQKQCSSQVITPFRLISTASIFFSSLVLFTLSCLPSEARAQQVIAITIDDLPFVGSNSNNPGSMRRTRERFFNIMQALQDNQVPATGFVIAGAVGKNNWELLQAFHDAGFSLGNHTYTHANLNRMSAERYIDEIARTDQKLAPVITTPKYFRYPYLAEGFGEKKRAVHAYLASHGYTVAPVTIDSKDYRFNERLLSIHWRSRPQHINRIKQQYLAYIWRATERAEKRNPNTKHILLIHANLLNSHCMADIIEMYKQKGFRFITLQEALAESDPGIVHEQIGTLSPRWVSPLGTEW